MKLYFCAMLLACALSAVAGISERASLRYPGFPPGASMQALAVDQASNLFVVAIVPELSGRHVFRVLKVDPQDNLLGSIDFGGQRTGLADGDQVVAAAVDPTGALVLAGTATSMDFPLVSPLITISGHSGFIMKLDPQLRNILFSTKLGGARRNRHSSLGN